MHIYPWLPSAASLKNIFCSGFLHIHTVGECLQFFYDQEQFPYPLAL